LPRRARPLVLVAVLVLAAPSAAEERYYLPDATASRTVTVGGTGEVTAEVTVLTQAMVEKETAPAETVARMGEVYAFAPAFFAVVREQPTQIALWNLQTDDEHDFMLVDPELNVLMRAHLAPLTRTSYRFTFHRAGLYTFYCTFHQPAMSGQVLVLPPETAAGR